MEFTNSFLARVNQICENCTNPEMGKMAMKRIMKSTMQLEHSRYILDLFMQLKQKHIGTTEVETLSKKMCKRLPPRRYRTLVDTIIK